MGGPKNINLERFYCILNSTPNASMIAKWTFLKEICLLPSINYDQAEIALDL
jgi:hypothetical protein